MSKNTIFQDLGLIDYKEAWDYQEKKFDEIVRQKNENKTSITNYLLFCEHPHVYTLGKSGSESNLLVNHIQLKAKNASFYKINRGGDITYHGPGQIVGYPIINLDAFSLGIKEYIHLLEEAVIQTLAKYSIVAERLEGATGVWIDTHVKGKTRKICAIGVRTSHWVTMHGFAFNVNTNLDYFNYINPCGFTDKAVTSMQKELGKEQNINEIKDILRETLINLFQMKIVTN